MRKKLFVLFTVIFLAVGCVFTTSSCGDVVDVRQEQLDFFSQFECLDRVSVANYYNAVAFYKDGELKLIDFWDKEYYYLCEVHENYLIMRTGCSGYRYYKMDFDLTILEEVDFVPKQEKYLFNLKGSYYTEKYIVITNGETGEVRTVAREDVFANKQFGAYAKKTDMYFISYPYCAFGDEIFIAMATDKGIFIVLKYDFYSYSFEFYSVLYGDYIYCSGCEKIFYIYPD